MSVDNSSGLLTFATRVLTFPHRIDIFQSVLFWNRHAASNDAGSTYSTLTAAPLTTITSNAMSDTAVRTLSSASIGPPIMQEVEEPHAGFEVDHQLNEAVGRLAGNFPCTFQDTKGTLFAGSGGVSFVGWTFFFQKRVDILWENVLQVLKTQTADTGGVGITFVMRQDHMEYEFRDIVHASERVWPILVNLHNESLHSLTKEPLVTPLRASLRRMSSDPIPIHHHEEGSPSGSGTEAAYVAAAAVASNDEFRASISSRNMAADSVARRQSLMMSSPPMALEDGHDETDLAADLQQAWNELQNGGTSNESYATSAIQVSYRMDDRDTRISCYQPLIAHH